MKRENFLQRCTSVNCDKIHFYQRSLFILFIFYNLLKMVEEGKDCFFSYHAKAELPPWIIYVRSCSAILSRISNHPSAEFLYCFSNQLLRAKFDQLPEITFFVTYCWLNIALHLDLSLGLSCY